MYVRVCDGRSFHSSINRERKNEDRKVACAIISLLATRCVLSLSFPCFDTPRYTRMRLAQREHVDEVLGHVGDRRRRTILRKDAGGPVAEVVCDSQTRALRVSTYLLI